MSKRTTTTVAAVLTASCCLATSPRIVDNSVTMAQSASRIVTVTYSLADAPAIVTLDIETNTLADATGDWVSIGQENVTYVTGDANRLVPEYSAQGVPHTIHWQPAKSWPNHVVENGCARAVVKAWAVSAPPPFLMVDLQVASNALYYASADAIPGGITNVIYKQTKMLFRLIPAGGVTWRMGSPSTEVGRNSANEDLHYVSFSHDYYMAIYPTTTYQHNICCDNKMPTDANPLFPKTWVPTKDLRGDCLNDGISWPTTLHVVKPGSSVDKYRKHSGFEGIDLPTEAQWEYACRAGTGSALYTGTDLVSKTSDTLADGTSISNIAHYGSGAYNLGGRADVGGRIPNAWNLYDMYGNVLEQCLDMYTAHLGTAAAEDPKGPDTSDSYNNAGYPNRTVRGASFSAGVADIRSASRTSMPDDANSGRTSALTGYRLVINLNE